MRPPTPTPDLPPSPTPISITDADDGIQELVPNKVHPVVWMAIGVAAFAVVFLFAALLGLFERRADAPLPSVAVVPADSGVLPRLADVSDVPKTAADSPTPGVESRPDSNVTTEKPTTKVLSAEDLYDRIAPSVVTINAKDEYGETIATGSGFFIDESLLGEQLKNLADWHTISVDWGNEIANQNGFVLTNYHVIRLAIDADIVIWNGNEGMAWDVIAEDEKADLALLSVSVPSNEPLQTIPLGLANPRVGSTVYAIGSPKGLSSTLSQGIVSGFRQLTEGRALVANYRPNQSRFQRRPIVDAEWDNCRRNHTHS